MECSYEVEVVAHVDFTDEEFAFMEKSMQEHPDMAMFIEYGTWFYGIKNAGNERPYPRKVDLPADTAHAAFFGEAAGGIRHVVLRQTEEYFLLHAGQERGT